MQSRNDPFLAYLSMRIREHQAQRADAVQRLRVEQEKIEELDSLLEMLETERNNRSVVLGAPEPAPRRAPKQREILTLKDQRAEEERQAAIDTAVEAYSGGASVLPPVSLVKKPRPAPAAPVISEIEARRTTPDIGLSMPTKTKAYKEATLVAVRNWFVQNPYKLVRTGEVAEILNIPRSIVGKRCIELEAKKILKHTGNRASSKYAYNSEIPPGPKEHPRHDRPTNRVGGAPVPHTRQVGPSGKPGLDKKRAGQGIRVKRHRLGI